jgi:predicted enzyme involved in methoxymalonyl-ACP biosynthesis
MISVVICRKCATVWEIDTWLMSCRVLKRRIEEAVLREIVERARAEGAEALIGSYIPTARNGMVANHYAGLGFTSIETSSDGSSFWHLPIDRAPDIDLPLRVERRGWAPGDTVMVG